MTTRRIIFGLLFLVIGVSALTGFNIFHYLVPLFFIFIGLRILSGRSRRYRMESQSDIHQDEINEVTIFSGSEKRVVSGAFTGGKMAAIFSAAKLDLTGVKTKTKTVELELVAVFSELKVTIPKGWQVASEGVGVVGEFNNRATGSADSQTKLVVRGSAVFGEVKIIN